ncbi:site-2 protease family protein [Caloranaerobacter azorensis]|uniref:site-2 protease family protein n=1 Tax=Caloranaerobacter azorensis TaxID=116090 RepID=UPI0020230B4A|nr:site-2 protease family protein [Caloranaerobacter azorensis]
MIPALLISITLHELAHGYVAYLLGDNTAKVNKRLTLNPIRHIDFIGFILLLTVGFGWAKPVPINPNNFKNKKEAFLLFLLQALYLIYFSL